MPQLARKISLPSTGSAPPAPAPSVVSVVSVVTVVSVGSSPVPVSVGGGSVAGGGVGSVGLGSVGLGGMAPSRRGDLARLSGRALFAGFLATMINAAMASMLL